MRYQICSTIIIGVFCVLSDILQNNSKYLFSVVLPSPMDGPSKTKKCHYIGTVPVHKPSGMDVVNNAIEKLANSTDK